jgi:hypothetical protein
VLEVGNLHWQQVQQKSYNVENCNEGMSQGQNSLVFKGKPPKFTNAKYLLVPTLIASFCEVTFKII